jgi:EAL domain-containing protein (putative c-di-GMP-specific phosphodiesterase class I)
MAIAHRSPTTLDPVPGPERAAPARGWEHIVSLLDEPQTLGMVYQPIASLATGAVVGYEALARFRTPVRRAPDVWFAQAWRCGLGPALEARALRLALDCPARPAGTHLTVNLSPSALSSPEVQACLEGDLDGIVIEVTEHELVDDYGQMTTVLGALRGRGARVAVDDAGAGYAGLERVMRLEPDVIKLDRALISGIDRDPGRAALVDAFVRFARRTGATVCAEGIETLDELAALAQLDVPLGQGWALAHPAPPWCTVATEATRTCHDVLRDALAGVRDPQAALRGEALFEQISADLSAATTLDEVAAVVVPLAEGLHADEVAISLVDAGTDCVVAVTGDGWMFDNERYPLGDFPATRHVLETRCALQILAGDPYADPDEVRLMTENDYASMLIVPIVFRNVSLGIVEAFSRVERPWTRTEITRARLACSHLGATIYALHTAG